MDELLNIEEWFLIISCLEDRKTANQNTINTLKDSGMNTPYFKQTIDRCTVQNTKLDSMINKITEHFKV